MHFVTNSASNQALRASKIFTPFARSFATNRKIEKLQFALQDFRQAFGRPGPVARLSRLEELGLNVDSDLERHLGRRVVESAPALAKAWG